jgi:TatD DNase family protein
MGIQLIDTHCHLYLSDFLEDIRQVIHRAEEEGITHFLLPAIDSKETDSLLQLENGFPGKCIAMMGLHPSSVGENYRDELKIVESWLSKRSFIAVGEIGLDHYWDRTYDKEQLISFQQQIDWALHYKIPIVIHSRNAVEECTKTVTERKVPALSGVFHCFTGSYDLARKIIDAGFYLGIGGVLTYKNSGLAETVKKIPLEYIVLETDAPYLTPVPFRGKRNESRFLKYVAQKLADVKGITIEEVSEITTMNARKIFNF